MPDSPSEESKPEPHRDRTAVLAAWIGGGCAIVAAVIGAVAIYSTNGHVPVPPVDTPSGSVPTSSSGTAIRVPGPVAEIFAPQNGDLLHGDASVLIEGTASGLGASNIWIFVKRYGIYYVSDANPLAVTDGAWSYRDSYIGSNINTGAFYIDVVLTNSACSEHIVTAHQQPGGGVAFAKIPQGCRVLDAVRVERVKP
jgi:hypothetical protein